MAELFEVIAKKNFKLKYLDVANNLGDIGMMRQLRLLLEKNSTLQYMTITGLHKFNQRAVESLSRSLAASNGIKLIDFKKTTKQFYTAMDQGVNQMREQLKKPKIIFLKDETFITLQQPTINDTSVLSKTSNRLK
jgi:hypothetical protein